jgi:Mce-associated membrane protein
VIGSVPTWLLAALAVLLAAVVAFDLIIGVRDQTAAAQQTTSTAAITSALQEAPVQAETAAVRALAFDYKTLQADADEAKNLMTPQYAGQFQKTVDELLQAPATQRKAHVEADVKASGVVDATASKVDVMLFVDQTSQTTLQSEPQTYLNRVVLTMVKSGDRWLVDNVTAL